MVGFFVCVDFFFFQFDVLILFFFDVVFKGIIFGYEVKFKVIKSILFVLFEFLDMKVSWFFDIYEDILEQEMINFF